MAFIALLITGAAHAETRNFTCYPKPHGEPPSSAVMYSGALATDILDELFSAESKLPTAKSLITMRRGDQIVVVLLNDAFACPLPVDRDQWDAALRKVLGQQI